VVFDARVLCMANICDYDAVVHSYICGRGNYKAAVKNFKTKGHDELDTQV